MDQERFLMNRVPEVLYNSADLIASRGLWKKGQTHTGHCVLTSILTARVELRLPSEVEDAALAAVQGRLGLRTARDVYLWNDAPARTQGEVVDMLRAAAVEAEAAEIVAGAESQPVAVFEVTR